MPANAQSLDDLRAERDQCRQVALSLIQADDYDPNSDAIKVAEERAAYLDGQIERLAAALAAQEAADVLDGRLSAATRRAEREDRGGDTRELSLGEAFVRSEEFTSYRGRGSSGMFHMETGRLQERALPTGVADLVAAGINPKTSVTITKPAPPTPLLDNVSEVQVSGNAVEFVTWAKKAGGAAVVAEKGAKPSIEWGPTVTSDTLDTIAGYTQLTRQLIEDYSAVRDYIDGELRREVYLKEEAEAVAALTAAAAAIPDATGADLLASIRVGIATVQSAGYSPTAVMLNPADWADLDNVLLGATLNGPQVRSNYWGLTVIPAASQPAGTATVGDFQTGITHFTRSGISVYITDSHADTFLSNVFTLLGERRSLTAVVRPQALAQCTVTP